MRTVPILGSAPENAGTGGGGSMTGAEILTAIKTVDGTGSGLDADLLDGSHATAFVLASGLTESVQDVVGAMVTAGANIDATYDDTAGTVTIAVTGLNETVQDIVGAMVIGSSGITAVYDDGGGTVTLTIGVGAVTNAMLAGSIAQSKITNLVTDLASKQDTSTLTESVQDIVGAFVTAGTNMSVTYDDPSNTLTLAVTGLTESVQDIVGGFTSGAGGVTVTYDDTANTLVVTIADGAITNAKLATNPLARANHTGTQTASTISDFTEASQDAIAAALTNGANITVTYDDTANTITVAVTGLTSANLSDFTEAVQDVVGALALGGSGLTVTYNDGANTWVMDVNVDGSSIEINADTLRVKALGITDAMLAGSISNTKLATNPLLRSNHTGDLTLPATTPAAPSGTDALFAARFARMIPLFVGPAGAALAMGDAQWARNWWMVTPVSGGSVRTSGTGPAAATSGTIATSGTSSTFPYRFSLQSAASTAARADVNQAMNFFRGTAGDISGGFEMHSVGRLPDASYDNTGASTGTRIWGGALSAASATLFGADRGGTQDLVGFVRAHVNGGATDTNWQFVTCDNTTTNTIDTGMAFAVSNLYAFHFWCATGSSTIFWRIDNLTTATTQNGSTSTNLPRATGGINFAMGVSTVDATARAIHIVRAFVASDAG